MPAVISAAPLRPMRREHPVEIARRVREATKLAEAYVCWSPRCVAGHGRPPVTFFLWQEICEHLLLETVEEGILAIWKEQVACAQLISRLSIGIIVDSVRSVVGAT